LAWPDEAVDCGFDETDDVDRLGNRSGVIGVDGVPWLNRRDDGVLTLGKLLGDRCSSGFDPECGDDDGPCSESARLENVNCPNRCWDGGGGNDDDDGNDGDDGDGDDGDGGGRAKYLFLSSNEGIALAACIPVNVFGNVDDVGDAGGDGPDDSEPGDPNDDRLSGDLATRSKACPSKLGAGTGAQDATIAAVKIMERI